MKTILCQNTGIIQYAIFMELSNGILCDTHVALLILSDFKCLKMLNACMFDCLHIYGWRKTKKTQNKIVQTLELFLVNKGRILINNVFLSHKLKNNMTIFFIQTKLLNLSLPKHFQHSITPPEIWLLSMDAVPYLPCGLFLSLKYLPR